MRKDAHLMKLLGAILLVGNTLNAGNAKKGQADGFDIHNLDATTAIKSKDNHSLLSVIVKQICTDDDSFKKIKETWQPLYDAKKINLPELNTKL